MIIDKSKETVKHAPDDEMSTLILIKKAGNFSKGPLNWMIKASPSLG